MPEKYADLTIYLGSVNSQGCGEGLLSLPTRNRLEADRRRYAIEIVERALRYSKERAWMCVELAGRDSDLVWRLDDAEKMIAYSQANIDGARPFVDPQRCSHGRIVFLHKIQFDGWTIEKRDELVQKLKKSGIKPCDEKKVWLELLFGGNLESESAKKELEKLDPDMPWKRALIFSDMS